MMPPSDPANSAAGNPSGLQTDPGVADTLPTELSHELALPPVDFDLDIGAGPSQAVDMNLDLDLDLSSTDPMFDAGAALATTEIPTTDTANGVNASDGQSSPSMSVSESVSGVMPLQAIGAGLTPAPAGHWPDTERRLPPSWTDKRVIVVSADETERTYLRVRLALVGLVWVDEAATTTQALSLLAVRPYAMAFVNMDSVAIDGGAIATQLHAGNVAATLILTSNAVSGGHPLNVLAQWRRWRLSRQLGHVRNAEVLAKPLEPREVAGLLSRLTTPLVV